MYSRPEYLETMLAAYKIRAVPINVNYRYVAEELAYLFDNADLRRAGPRARLRPDRGLDPRSGADLSTYRGRGRVARGRGACPTPSPTRTSSPPTSGSADFGPRSADDLYIAYTGGTTGHPKV